jgi:hypothetical protein
MARAVAFDSDGDGIVDGVVVETAELDPDRDEA